MAEEKLLAPNVTIWWIPDAGVADPTAITTAEVNAGSNISCAIVAGYTLNPTDPNVDNTKSICDNANVDNPTQDQYNGNLTFFRDKDVTNNDSVYNKAFQLFRYGGAVGYLVRRVGKLNSDPAADGDDIQPFSFESDLPSSIDGGENPPPVQFTVPFIPNGKAAGAIQTLATTP